MIEHANRVDVIEVKAGQTITADMLRPARRVRDTLGEAVEARATVVYGGEESQARSDIDIVSWRHIDFAPGA